MPSDNDFFHARNRADGFIPDEERPMPTDPRSHLLTDPRDTDDELENIDIMLHALREATTEVERRRFARAIARYFEYQLVQLTDRMSAMVNALSLENQVRIRLQPGTAKRGASEVELRSSGGLAVADGASATKPYQPTTRTK